MRDLTLSGFSPAGDEITVSAPTISGCIIAFRKAEAAARALRVTNPGTFAEESEPVLIAAPVDLDERAKVTTAPTPAVMAGPRTPLTARQRAVAFTSMTPADRRPNPEPVAR